MNTVCDLFPYLVPDLFTHTALLKSAANDPTLDPDTAAEAAEVIFAQLLEEGLQPNVVVFTSLMTLAQRAGRWRRCVDLLEEMRRRGVKADVVTHNTVISALVRSVGSTRHHLSGYRGIIRRGYI